MKPQPAHSSSIPFYRGESREALAQALADQVAGELGAAIAARGQASLVVSGGSTPLLFFVALEAKPLDWSKVTVTLADERFVDPSHKDSNERLLREHLLTGGARFISLRYPPVEQTVPSPGNQEGEQTVPSPIRGGGLGRGPYTARRREILANAKELRKRTTDAEKIIWSVLRRSQMGGYKFRRQYSIGSYVADFACLEKQLIIELDGGQHSEQQSYDQKRDTFLREAGFTVLRFWNNEVIDNLDGVIEVIWQTLQAPLLSSPRKRVEGTIPSPAYPRKQGEETTPSLPPACGGDVRGSGEELGKGHPSPLEQTAHAADAALRTIPLPFDVVILGMGDDAHTASLFPHHPQLKAALDPAQAQLCLPITDSPKPPPERLTLTFNALTNARRLYVHITGEAKKPVAERAIARHDPQAMPISAFLHQARAPIAIWWAA